MSLFYFLYALQIWIKLVPYTQNTKTVTECVLQKKQLPQEILRNV